MFYDGWKNTLSLLWASLLGRVAVPVDLPPLPLIYVDEPAQPKRLRRAPYTHLGDVLAQLPECRRLLRKMKKVDPDAYAYHSRMGAKVRGRLLHEGALLPKFLETLPAAGMVYGTPDDGKSDKIGPAFCYFTKWKPSPYVFAPRNADAIYEVTYAYLPKNGPFQSAVVSFHVAIKDGQSTLLKQRNIVDVRLPGRNGGSFTRIAYGYPKGLGVWHKYSECNGLSLEELAVHAFQFAANEFVADADGFQVRAEAGGISVAFNVSLGDSAKFFKNRDITELAADGKQKRIFHYVAAHTRASGSEVKAHYRGLRRFTWEGNKVVITSPRNSALAFTQAAVTPDQTDGEPSLNAGEVAAIIRGALEGRAS